MKNNPGGLSRCGKRSRCLRLAPQAGLRQRPGTHSSHTTSIVTTLRNGTLVKYTSIRESSQCPPKVGSAVVRLAGPARVRCTRGEKFAAVNFARHEGRFSRCPSGRAGSRPLHHGRKVYSCELGPPWRHEGRFSRCPSGRAGSWLLHHGRKVYSCELSPP